MQGNTYPVTAERVAPSALSLIHPDLAEELAAFLVLARWRPADLKMFSGDPVFTAEVQAAMRRPGTLAASYRPSRHLRVVP